VSGVVVLVAVQDEYCALAGAIEAAIPGLVTEPRTHALKDAKY
jgi:hypothetical protein